MVDSRWIWGSEKKNIYSMVKLPDGTPQIKLEEHVIGEQSVNLKAAKIIAAEIGEPVGATITHEINEAYIGTCLILVVIILPGIKMLTMQPLN